MNIIFQEFLQYCIDSKQTNINGLIVANISLLDQGILKEDIKHSISFFNNVHFISWHNIGQTFGQTFDFLLIDISDEFNPNKLNLVIETVRGGGVIFLRGFNYPEWVYSVNKDYFSEINGDKSNLLEWFLSNLKDNSQCFTGDFATSEVISRFNLMPFYVSLNTKINEIAVTNEQKEVINSLVTDFKDSKQKNMCSVLVANRGRGKSASIGVFLAQIMSEKKESPLNIILVAPYIMNIQILLKFLLKGLNSRNISYKLIKKESSIIGLSTSNNSRIKYITPDEVKEQIKCNLIVIDEAAAVPLEKLKETLKTSQKKIFASTIHGYEGAGRGFQHKIIGPLKRQSQIKYNLYSLNQPIRYTKNDQIEKLMNDTFLLEVEPIPWELDAQSIDREQLLLREYRYASLYFSEEGLPQLKQLFGILIYAHYRNQPNDLLLLADSQRHFLVGLWEKKGETQSTLLGASQLVMEGEINDDDVKDVLSGHFKAGDLIPIVAIRHFSTEFAKLKGLRIIRIAVHPSIINKGFGRLTVEHILEQYSSYDWIGVSFGLTVKLMKFWAKFKFKPVHIRPIKTPETGEWNLVVIRPLSTAAKQIVNQASADFMLQFLALLRQSLHSMKPELVALILKNTVSTSQYEPQITSSGKVRLQHYLEGTLNFLLTVDIMYELTTTYFVNPPKIKLSSIQESLLIARVLQGRTWGQTLGKTGLNWKAANGLLKKAIEKLAQVYVNERP